MYRWFLWYAVNGSLIYRMCQGAHTITKVYLPIYLSMYRQGTHTINVRQTKLKLVYRLATHNKSYIPHRAVYQGDWILLNNERWSKVKENNVVTVNCGWVKDYVYCFRCALLFPCAAMTIKLIICAFWLANLLREPNLVPEFVCSWWTRIVQ